MADTYLFDSVERQALAQLGSATLGESGGLSLSPAIAAVWPGAVVVGPAYVVRCAPGDNLALHVAVTTAPAGSVLVADVGGAAVFGYWGEVLTRAARRAGLAGLVINGGVRDVAAIEALGFPVFASCVALRGASKTRGGAVGGAARIAEVDISTGDWLVGDRDGITAVASAALAEVAHRGQVRAAHEAHLFERLDAGDTTIEMLALDRRAVQVLDVSAPPAEAGGPAVVPDPAGVIRTDASPVPSGAYSQARRAGDLVYVAGVGPYDPGTRAIVGEGIEEQTDRTMANIEAILTAAALSFDDVVSTTVYLADVQRDWQGFDRAYGRWFAGPPPARAAVGATLKNILVEIVVTARAAGGAPVGGAGASSGPRGGIGDG